MFSDSTDAKEARESYSVRAHRHCTHVSKVPEPDRFGLPTVNIRLVIHDTDCVSDYESKHEVFVNCQPITLKGPEIRQEKSTRDLQTQYFCLYIYYIILILLFLCIQIESRKCRIRLLCTL